MMEMDKLYVGNAFSIQMLDDSEDVIFLRTNRENAKRFMVSWLEDHKVAVIESAIGHKDMAELVSKELDWPLPAERKSIKLRDNDALLVAQYIGPRLPEGATELPEGASIEYWLVWLRSEDEA